MGLVTADSRAGSGKGRRRAPSTKCLHAASHRPSEESARRVHSEPYAGLLQGSATTDENNLLDCQEPGVNS